MIAVLLVVTGILLFIHQKGKTEQAADQGGSAGAEPPSSSGRLSKWRGPLPVEAARLFIGAKIHKERLELIADPLQNGEVMERFFREGAGAGEKVMGIDPLGPATTGLVTFERYQVRLETGGSRLLCIILREEGGKIDF
ncbi:MAG: hypothetical protein CFE26_21725, partial [Verrucomicrobiales bacterium VVV1]